VGAKGEQQPDGPGNHAPRQDSARRDVLALAVAAAAIVMFIGTGASVVPQVVRAFAGAGIGPDRVLVNALLLNIALIIFGWRRYREMLTEVAERRKAEARARKLADTDALTGCLNRRSMIPALTALIEAARPQGRDVAVVMIDLDNFKCINDFHGHAVGDATLESCARRIVAEFPDDALVARLGGDEFACALSFDPGRIATLDQLAERMITAMGEPIAINGGRVTATASLGLAHTGLGHGASDPQTLLKMADIAMYGAKQAGRNRAAWFEEGMLDDLRQRGEIEACIREGLINGEFMPYYEQQVDLQSGEITGFEMLMRWRSPKLGAVTPDVFIPVAEEMGAIGALSETVIAMALCDARQWDPRLTLAVNVSPRQLRDPWFAQRLLKLLVEANFPPERLEVEITESCLHENIGMVHSVIASLRNLGIRITLDDFGTGYNSLAQLRNFAFDRIKIDRSFVRNLGQCEDSAMIFEGIAMLGRGLGLPITAEGIESDSVLERLREFGELKGQGYLYGKPQPAAQVRERLAQLGLLGEAATPAPVLHDAPPTLPRTGTA